VRAAKRNHLPERVLIHVTKWRNERRRLRKKTKPWLYHQFFDYPSRGKLLHRSNMTVQTVKI
jgi:hypothetical protein